jgi:hypothetical protein
MGLRTKAEFRQDLDGVIGTGRKEPDWLDRRVHEGYVDVATAVLHSVTKRETEFDTVVGQTDYDEPENSVGIVSVYDMTEKKPLVYIESENLDHYDFSRSQTLRLWTMVGASIRVYPEPWKVDRLKITWHTEPGPLDEETDQTILPARWDTAIGLSAAHFAFLNLLEEERAQIFLERFVSYMGSRLAAEDIRRSPGMPLTVPRSFEDLRRTRGI